MNTPNILLHNLLSVISCGVVIHQGDCFTLGSFDLKPFHDTHSSSSSTHSRSRKEIHKVQTAAAAEDIIMIIKIGAKAAVLVFLKNNKGMRAETALFYFFKINFSFFSSSSVFRIFAHSAVAAVVCAKIIITNIAAVAIKVKLQSPLENTCCQNLVALSVELTTQLVESFSPLQKCFALFKKFFSSMTTRH